VDLGAVVRYIAFDNSYAAEALARTIFERTRMLADFPHAGRRVPEEHDAKVREIIVEPYRIIYELSESATVDILRIWHSARGKPQI
jgi:plasmid stabilization system protein ParE